MSLECTLYFCMTSFVKPYLERKYNISVAVFVKKLTLKVYNFF